MDLYWHMKFLLGRILLYWNERRENILHSMEHLHWHMKDLDQWLERTEKHLGIHTLVGGTLGGNKDPI